MSKPPYPHLIATLLIVLGMLSVIISPLLAIQRAWAPIAATSPREEIEKASMISAARRSEISAATTACMGVIAVVWLHYFAFKKKMAEAARNRAEIRSIALAVAAHCYKSETDTKQLERALREVLERMPEGITVSECSALWQWIHGDSEKVG